MNRVSRLGPIALHGVMLSCAFFVFASSLALRESVQAWGVRLSGQFCLIVSLKPGLPEAATGRAWEAIRHTPGVVLLKTRDPIADQNALLAAEPWAAEFQSALSDRFLPPMAEAQIQDPYRSRQNLTRIEAEIRKVEEVSTVAFNSQAYDETVTVLHDLSRASIWGVAIAAALAILWSIGLEVMRRRGETHGAGSQAARLIEALWLGGLSGAIGAACATAIALLAGKAWEGAVRPPSLAGGLLTILTGICFVPAASLAVEAFQALFAHAPTAATPAPAIPEETYTPRSIATAASGRLNPTAPGDVKGGATEGVMGRMGGKERRAP